MGLVGAAGQWIRGCGINKINNVVGVRAAALGVSGCWGQREVCGGIQIYEWCWGQRRYADVSIVRKGLVGVTTLQSWPDQDVQVSEIILNVQTQ